MKKNALVLCGSANMAFAIASTLMDFIKYNYSLVDDIIIFHNGFVEKDIDIINSIVKCRFELYKPPFAKSINFNQGTVGYFTEMVFSKIECLRLLDAYKKILFLDYDIIIKDNLNELFSKKSISGVRLQESGPTIVRNQFTDDIFGYDMSLPSSGYGIFIFEDSLQEHANLYQWCVKNTHRFIEKLYCPEQGIFELMFQEFKIFPDRDINADLYCCHPSSLNVNKAKIIHAWGQPKFWNGINNEQWNVNYRSWKKMGGTPYISSKESKYSINIIKKLIDSCKNLKF